MIYSPMRKVALSFLAHPDDAEIQCAGTLIRLKESGWEIHIITATPGDCGTTQHGRLEISAIRIKEARASAALIGATYHCLDERDLLVMYDKPTTMKTIELFRRIAPSVVFTHPAKDYMLDHEMVHLLARNATFAYGIPNISDSPIVAGSQVPYLYYVDPVDGVDPLGNAVDPTTVIDISEQLEQKMQMLACHASQREWLRAHHGIDEYIEAMHRHAAARGKLILVPAAEGFIQHRGHAYPADDLLTKLFGKVA